MTGVTEIDFGIPHSVQGGVLIVPFAAIVSGMPSWIDKTGPCPFVPEYVSTMQ